jgi:DNA-binding SARP family transcriptional activator
MPAVRTVGEHMSLMLLGGFQVAIDGRQIEAEAWRERRAAKLLQYLALSPGYRCSRESLVDALWPYDPLVATGVRKGPNPATRIREAKYSVRQILKPYVVDPRAWFVKSRGQDVLGPAEAITLDVVLFESLAARAQRTRAIADYQAAVARYSGDLLPDDRTEEWTQRRRDTLATTHLNLLFSIARLATEQRQPGVAVEALVQVCARAEDHEEAHRQLMRLYASTGQRHLAFRQYQRLRAVLRELHAVPEPATEILYKQILAAEYAPIPVLASAETW